MMNLIPQVTFRSSLSASQSANAKYSLDASKLIDPATRIDDCLSYSSVRSTELLNAQNAFVQKNPNLTAQNMNLPLAHMVPLSEIMIDDTMNRPVNWKHLMNIVVNFTPELVDAIRVYVDQNSPGKYIAWDGQHTTLALYILFGLVYGADLSKVMVPVVLNRSNDKKVIRLNFILHNSSVKKGGIKQELSELDLFGQQVFGVRIDGSTNPTWIESEAKQTALENAGLYLHPGDGQVVLPGAIVQPQKFISAPLHVAQMVCKFEEKRLMRVQREIDGQEYQIIEALMNEFHNSDIELDNQDYTTMVDIFYKSFNIDFRGKNKVSFYRNLDNAFENWYNAANNLKPGQWQAMTDTQKRMYPDRQEKLTANGNFQIEHSVAYLVAILRKFGPNKGFNKFPSLANPFVPASMDVK
jgi:hypothetical protein